MEAVPHNSEIQNEPEDLAESVKIQLEKLFDEAVLEYADLPQTSFIKNHKTEIIGSAAELIERREESAGSDIKISLAEKFESTQAKDVWALIQGLVAAYQKS